MILPLYGTDFEYEYQCDIININWDAKMDPSKSNIYIIMVDT